MNLMYYSKFQYIPKCFEFHIICSTNLEKQFNNSMFIVHIIKHLEFTKFHTVLRVEFLR